MAAPTQVVNGSQITRDQAEIANWAAQNELTRRGQDITAAGSREAAGASRYASDKSAQASMYASDKSYAAALLDYAAKQDAAAKQYDIDLKNYGLNTARFNYEQRAGQAQTELAQRSQGLAETMGGLEFDKFNFTQRNTLADKKLGIMDALSKRAGPQDWVGYNFLSNMLNEPNPNKSTTFDPFSILNGLVQESKFQMPDWAPRPSPASLLNQPMAPEAPRALRSPAAPTQSTGTTLTPMSTSSGGGGGGGGWFGAGAAAAAPTTAAPAPAPGSRPGSMGSVLGPIANQTMTGGGADANYSGVPNSAVAGLQSGQGGLFSTGSAGTSQAADYKGFNVVDPVTGQPITGEVGAGKSIWLQRLAKGGSVGGDQPISRDEVMALMQAAMGAGAPTAIVGDASHPTGHEEVAQAMIGPDGRPRLNVMPHKQAAKKGLLKKGAKKGAKKPLRRAAGGGSVGPGPSGIPDYAGNSYGTANTDPTYTWNQYDPQTLGSQPFIQKLFGQRRAPAWSGFAASLDNPSIGIQGAPGVINLQNYSLLGSDEKAATQNLYEKGLSMDWGSTLERARRAAPLGRAFGVASYGA